MNIEFRTINKIWCTALMLGGSLVWCGCNDQIAGNQATWSESTEAQTTEVTLQLTTTPLVEKTRAAISSQADSKIYNLWLFVFDSEGHNGQLFRFQNPEDKVTFSVKSGEHRIYALANVDEATDLVTFSHDLSAVTDVEGLKQAVATLQLESVFRYQGHLVMSGTYDGSEGSVDILPLGHVSLPHPLLMKRLDARINFHIGLDPNDPELANKCFTPTSWQVFNIASGTALFADSLPVQTTYFDMEQPLPFEQCDHRGTTDNYSFTFYALENNQRGSGATQWSDRERKVKDESTGINTTLFANAPQNATYVKLCGQFTYDYTNPVSGLPSHQSANVEYTIHLGYLGEDAFNNYECERNTSYSYNVIVKGVNEIEVKVEEDNDEEDNGSSDEGPGQEGDVIEATYYFDFDAHYDRSILQFDHQTILTNPNLQGFYVNTPFDQGFYYVDDDELESPYPNARPASEAKDYSWIKFRRCDMKSDSIYNGTSFSYYDPNNVIDVKQLIKALRTGRDQNGFAVYDRNGKAFYTLFVDENYYTHDPRTGEHGPVDFWKQFVNQKPREMYIFCYNLKTLDKQSSLTFGNIQIRQRSIYTHYDVNAPDELQTAWGVETRNETGQIRAEIVNPWDVQGLTSNNAVKNQLLQLNLVGMEWNTFLSTDIGRGDYHNQLNDNSEYSTFVYACIQRNRDEDGDGIIDREELKWVPATTDQYNELWIGSNSLPNEVRLYPIGSRDYHRYLSSTGDEILAEEGSSISEYGTLSYDGILGLSRPTRYDYRCIRLLGFDSYESDEVMPQSLYKVNAAQQTISLQWLDPSCKRTADFILGEEMEEADHNSYINYPYTMFEYTDATETGEQTAGWRLPNQREMAIMMQCLENGWGEVTEQAYYNTNTTSAAYLTGKADARHYGTCIVDEEGRIHRRMELKTEVPASRVRLVRDKKY